METRRATIIYNPMSGRPGRRAEAAQRMQRLLQSYGMTAEACPTRGPEDAATLARDAVENQVHLVIAYGGDGTVNEVVQGMAGTRVPLGVWAGGTSNVVARELGLPADPVQLARVFAAGQTKRIALGKASSGSLLQALHSESSGGSSGLGTRTTELGSTGRYFVMMAGIGLDASIARGVNQRLKRRMGELAYWVSGVKHLIAWQPEVFTLDVDGRRFESAFALIGKGRGYGGGMSMTPNARLDEPCFEVYVLPPFRHNYSYVRPLLACMRKKPEAAGAVLIKGRLVIANSSRQPWVELDGEIVGPLPMKFEVVPDALSVVVP